MINLNDILVTTTPSIDGMNVKQYIKPISAHVVAGTNFFSDFFASFSDVFGGRSQTYQKQLSSIYSEVIETLKRTAHEIGANCIIGLSIDLDEISGKGKSMFMITATGTAVIIENISKIQKNDNNDEKFDLLTIEKLNELRNRKKIIQLCSDKMIDLNDANWDFITNNSVYEVANDIIQIVSHKYETIFDDTERNKLYVKLLNYIASLPESKRIDILFEYLMSNKSPNFTLKLYKLINDLGLFDDKKIEKYLLDEDEAVRRKALQIVSLDKLFYIKEDIKMYENLVKIIENQFPIVAQFSSQKKLLSSKEIEVWACICGSKNEKEEKYCSKCKRDIYGFYSGRINPIMAIEKINENISFIKNYVK
jgi:uncharacterized protein YbjQ (UPF0145 family)